MLSADVYEKSNLDGKKRQSLFPKSFYSISPGTSYSTTVFSSFSLHVRAAQSLLFWYSTGKWNQSESELVRDEKCTEAKVLKYLKLNYLIERSSFNIHSITSPKHNLLRNYMVLSFEYSFDLIVTILRGPLFCHGSYNLKIITTMSDMRWIFFHTHTGLYRILFTCVLQLYWSLTILTIIRNMLPGAWSPHTWY